MGMDRSPLKNRNNRSSASGRSAVVQGTQKENDNFGRTYTSLVGAGAREREAACGGCKIATKASDEAVQCDNCNHWFHVRCSGISSEAYSHLTKLESFDWSCDKCKNEIKVLKEENDRMKEENLKLRRENESLKDRLNTLEKRLEDLKIELKSDIVSEVMKEIKEAEDKKSREGNLIIYNVPESEAATSKDRRSHDENMCEKLFVEGVRIDKQDFNMTNVIRLGKITPDQQNEKPRPILVKFQNSRQKWNILKNAKNLKGYENNGMNRISIVPDLTIKEREIDRKLRNDLKAKKDMGENDWYIKGGKLVKKNF